MQDQIILELIKVSTMTGLLGWISYTLWRRFDARVKANELELKELRHRYDTEVMTSRLEMKNIAIESNIIMRDIKNQMSLTNTVMSRTTNVMERLTTEIKKNDNIQH